MYVYSWASGASDIRKHVPDLLRMVSSAEPYVGLSADYNDEDLEKLLRALESGVQSGRVEVLQVNEKSGASVACVALTRATTANQRHIATMTTGMVHPNHRHQGIVANAFREVTRRCSVLGIELLLLDVREGIPAEHIWRSFGFEEYGRLEDYGRIGRESYAGIFMSTPVARLRASLTEKETANA